MNGALLFGNLAEGFVKVQHGPHYLTLGVHAYLPTLPDPYAANVEQLKFQFRGANDSLLSLYLPSLFKLWCCQLRWDPENVEPERQGGSLVSLRAVAQSPAVDGHRPDDGP